MASLTLDGLTKRYGDNAVVTSVSLAVRDGEFLVLLGPSGSATGW
jgi:ABC-type sugar transport system ATPase subunit